MTLPLSSSLGFLVYLRFTLASPFWLSAGSPAAGATGFNFSLRPPGFAETGVGASDGGGSEGGASLGAAFGFLSLSFMMGDGMEETTI
jgi:hypothetical protein